MLTKMQNMESRVIRTEDKIDKTDSNCMYDGLL